MVDTLGIKLEHQRAALVKFSVLCETKFGESLCLLGSTRELHAWDMAAPIELSSDNYTLERPIWETPSKVPMPLNTQVEYKFLKRLPESKALAWEQLPGDINRTLCMSASKNVEIQHIFGQTAVQIDMFREDSGAQLPTIPEDVKESSSVRTAPDALTIRQQPVPYGRLRKQTMTVCVAF